MVQNCRVNAMRPSMTSAGSILLRIWWQLNLGGGDGGEGQWQFGKTLTIDLSWPGCSVTLSFVFCWTFFPLKAGMVSRISSSNTNFSILVTGSCTQLHPPESRWEKQKMWNFRSALSVERSLDGSTLAPLTGEWHESYFRGWTPRVQSPQLNYLARISKAEGGTFFTQEGLPCGSEILQSTQSTDRNIMQCETCQPVIHCHIWKGARSEFGIRWKNLRSNKLKLKCHKHQGLHGWNAR